MKNKKKFSAVIVALALAMGLVVGAGAATARQQIAATLRPDITVKLDGEAQAFKNAKGETVYPIMYNGTTYLPVRSAGELAGFQVDWDQATQTVLLASKSAGGVDLIDTLKPYDAIESSQIQTADKKTQDISGISCSHWISIYMRWTTGKGETSHISYNVNGKYDTLTFKYYSEKDAILRVLGDNDSVLAQIPLKGGQVAQTAEVNLLKTSQLTFQVEKTHDSNSPWDGYTAFVFDAKLK